MFSCLVFQEKSQNEPVLTPNLERVCLSSHGLTHMQGAKRIKEVTFKLAEIQKERGVDIRPEEAVLELRFGLVEAVHEWARGMSFKDITCLTDVLEGIDYSKH